MTQPNRTIFNSQLASVLLMSAGLGWICGNFVQPVATPWGAIADILHLLPFIALLPLGLSFFSEYITGKRASGARIGISIVAAFGILACVVFIILGATNPDPNSVGVHTFEDTMPVIVLNLGTLLWYATLLFGRRGAQATAMDSTARAEITR
jgi:phosphoglycerol transferase MdoB-like AlkP superfamily enzyme